MSKRSILIVFSLFIFINQNNAQDILGWRCIDRTGHYASGKLLREWPVEGPKMVLKVDSLPESYSSAVVKDDVIFTTGIIDTAEILTAINMDGSIKWSVIYGNSWKGSYANARCTPSIEGNNAFLISRNGDLACVDIDLGKLKWSFNGFVKFEGKCGNWAQQNHHLLLMIR